MEQALALLRQAHALDRQHAGAEAQLRSVEREIARRDFNAAMTAGYAALDDARYDEAERQFLRAQKILPSAAETENALLQTRNSRTRAKIDAYGVRAREAEDREAWSQAIEAYREILSLDDTVVFARAGMIRSQTRARLDKRLRETLAKPGRLGDDRIYQDTRALYRQLLALEKKGPLLREQLEATCFILTDAGISVACGSCPAVTAGVSPSSPLSVEENVRVKILRNFSKNEKGQPKSLPGDRSRHEIWRWLL